MSKQPNAGLRPQDLDTKSALMNAINDAASQYSISTRGFKARKNVDFASQQSERRQAEAGESQRQLKKPNAGSALLEKNKMLTPIGRPTQTFDQTSGTKRGQTSDHFSRSPRGDHAFSALDKSATADQKLKRDASHNRSHRKEELQAKLHKLKSLFWPDNCAPLEQQRDGNKSASRTALSDYSLAHEYMRKLGQNPQIKSRQNGGAGLQTIALG